MDSNDVLNKVYALIDSIKQTDEFKMLKDLKKEIDNSLSEVIKKFDKAKLNYEEALQYGKYHPDLEKYKMELSKIKEELFTNELVTKYKALEKKLQGHLDVITSEIKKNMSNKFNKKQIEL